MCGITGFLDLTLSNSADECRAIVTRMNDCLAHRGPDDEGTWVDREMGIVLGHRRLAIIDLSPEGHQPMVSACGSYIIVYNGEIYNFKSIRKELEQIGVAPNWRGHSDTEVMLAAISHWGLEKALERFNGMFAFALWDRKDRVLYLARDRLGEKPLYYGWMDKVFLFASELKALQVHPAWRGEINREALPLLLRHDYVPAPYSIYKGIHKLMPGTLLSLPLSAKAGEIPEPVAYWSAKAAAEQGTMAPFTGTETEAIDKLDQLLRDAIKLRMEADVPLGTFLSGGIDSSTVVALMQAQSERAVKTFSIGFHEDGYNEAEYAKAVAQHLGTAHTELYVTPEETMAVIPRLPTLWDEPFSDPSQVPTFLVSQLARQHVTVSLSGDGGDELFGGYNRYFWGRRIWKNIGWMPYSLRSLMAKGLISLSPQLFNRGPLHKLKQPQMVDKLQKLAEIVAVDSQEDMYKQLISDWKYPESALLNVKEPLTVVSDKQQWAKLPDLTQWMMYLDLVTYLPDDILVKVDRASMGVSLESRVPLLDHRLVEFAWQLPLSFKIHQNQGKWLLRQVLYRYVPKELIERPKMGFAIPIDKWLRGPLREWAEALLNPARLQREGFFNHAVIQEKWLEHLSGKRNWQYCLWDVLMFQAWLEANSTSS
jgi:asparagine synthase (glutamine-hydrolysing)